MRTLALLAVLMAAGGAWAQNLPLIAGAQLETGVGSLPGGKTGAGIVRICPYIGAWLMGLGYVKIGGTYYESSSTDSNDVETGWKERDLMAQLGLSLGGPGRPYIIGSYTAASQLSDLGDADWNEWGLGLGSSFPLGPMCGLTMEAEYRWIEDHYEAVRDRQVSGTRIQLNLGFFVYFY